MSTILTFNGNARTFPDDFTGTAYAAIWEPFWTDVAADLRFVQGVGAISLSSTAIGTGAKSFTLTAAANLKAGTYKIQSAAGVASNTDFMIVTLAADLVAGTALSVTSELASGSGTKADWIIMPVWGTTRRPRLAKTANYTVVAADLDAVIDCSGTFTVSLTAAATLGDRFTVGIRNSGTGLITIDPNSSETIDGYATIALLPGQSVELICDGSNWKVVASVGYGSPVSLGLAHAIAASFS